MRTRRFGAMLLLAASLLACSTSSALASDWLGGPHWGRISGCVCCGQRMYGGYLPQPACGCQPMGWAHGAEGASRTRIVPVEKAAIPTPFVPVATKGKQQVQSKVGDCACGEQSASSCNECNDCNQCGGGCGLCGGHFGKGCHGLAARRGMRDEGAFFNCGCNGSYKFPVPPLYTYHWPGMYSMQLMTDYHSPWRFPPLRPYVDEPEGDYFSQAPAPIVRMGDIEPTSAAAPYAAPAAGEVERMSQAMERFYR